jgi:hypothetical protein
VRQFRAQGIVSLDVGCLQVNLFYHPDAFTSVEQAFEPAANAAYAARLLLTLYGQTGSWPLAAASYHSATPALGRSYEQKVLTEWAVPDRALPYRAKTGPREDPSELEAATARPGKLPVVAAGAGLPVPAQGATGVARPPATGFVRSFTLPAAPGGIGRSLAAYRAMPVRLALRPAAGGLVPR